MEGKGKGKGKRGFVYRLVMNTPLRRSGMAHILMEAPVKVTSRGLTKVNTKTWLRLNKKKH